MMEAGMGTSRLARDGRFLVRIFIFAWGPSLGASLDRDFASPGLLGVRWDGPAGGDTFRDPVAEPRPGSRSRACVSGPSAGGWPKVALMTQVGARYDSYGGRSGPGGPNQRKKKRRGNGLSSRDLRGSPSSYARTKWAIFWSRAASPLALATTHGTGPLGHFMGAVFGNKLAPNRQRRRCPRS